MNIELFLVMLKLQGPSCFSSCLSADICSITECYRYHIVNNFEDSKIGVASAFNT